jgi:hypothetical protein
MIKRIAFAPAMLLTFAVSAHAEPTSQLDQLKSWAASASKELRDRAEHQHAACSVNAFLDHEIVRSNDPRLRQGDRVVSVGGIKVGAADDIAKLVHGFPANGVVSLGLVRSGKPISVVIQCGSTADALSARISAVDAAAAGDLNKCIGESYRYGRQYVQFAGMYSLWRRCSLAAGKLSEIERWSTLVAYWTLQLQEFRQRPSKLEAARSHYLIALTELTNAGQPVLADELRRQWAIASGESVARATDKAVRATPSRLPNVPPPPTYAKPPPRSTSSDCESGHWIESVTDDGSIIKLEDGSIWRVDDADTVDSALWLATTEIVVCDGKLIDTDDNESVEAQRIR